MLHDVSIPPKFLDQHAYGTARRQKEFQSNTVRNFKEGGFKHVILDSCILSVNGTRKMVRDSILRSLQTGKQILDRWRDLTSIMYPNRPHLMERIPQDNKLTIAKLANGGWMMTDICNAARNYCRPSVELIKQIVEEEGIPKERIKVFKTGKVITKLYSIFFSTLTLYYRNFFAILLFFRLL